jgi:hypothetical protein
MLTFAENPRFVLATVQDVLPLMGLAYVVDGDDRCWGITRSTPGAEIDALRVGGRVSLTVERHDDFFVASSWSVLD